MSFDDALNAEEECLTKNCAWGWFCVRGGLYAEQVKQRVRFMNIPNNEGMACDAVIRHLVKWTGKARAEIRHPESDGVGPPVELRLQLGNQNYAIEHTRVESFDNQIKASISIGELKKFIKERFRDPLPGPVYYELQVPMDVCLPEKRKDRERMLNTLDKWIRESACRLHGRNTDLFRPLFAPIRSKVWHDDCVTGTPLGTAYEIKLMRTKLWPPALHTAGRKPGTIVLWYNYLEEDERNDRYFRRLQRAFDKKCPKLKHCKDEGARTVLILEAVDSFMTLNDQIGRYLPALLDGRKEVPDDIYLVDPSGSLWRVYPVKHDDDHWPDVGMPPRGQPLICEEDLLGIPTWYRNATGLDDLNVIIPRKWFPATFEQHELDDLTRGRVSEM